MGSDIPKGARVSPETDTLFRLDIKGDRQNLAYQSLHQASVPKYRNVGRGNVIGLDRGFRILKSSDIGRKVAASSLDSGVRQRQQFPAIAEPQPSQLLRAPQEQKDAITDQVEYVAITNSHARKRRRLSTEDESDDNSGPDDSKDFNDELSAQTTSSLDAVDHGVFQRQRELAELTSKRPDDIDAWHALLDLQSDIVRATTDRHVRLTAAQQRTVSDLRISIYQEALSKAKDAVVRNELTYGLMTEGSKVWDRGKQLAEWHMLIKHNPSFESYVLYLNFIQTNHVNFSYERCVHAYRDWFQHELNKPDEQDKDTHCLYILLRLTVLMTQCGYSELATAIWQSMAEFNFYRPTSTPADQALNALEGFWDTECARFGEPGAKGWNSAIGQHAVTNDDPAIPKLHTANLYHDWYQAEKLMSARASLSARTLDNTSEDDPYRVALFSDFRDYLFQLSSTGSEQSLTDALLC